MCPDKTYNRTYKGGGWQGWGHWLGTGNTKKGTEQFLPFGKALAAARSLNLANTFEWKEWCKEGMRPPKVPSNPNRTYNWLQGRRVAGVGPLARHGQPIQQGQ